MENLEDLKEIIENELVIGDVLEFNSNSYDKVKEFIFEKCKGNYDINKKINIVRDGTREYKISIKKIKQ